MFSNNAYATILLCSHLLKDDIVKPFSIAEWSDLAIKIMNSKIKEPAGLLNLSKQELISDLVLSEDMAERVALLLSRGVNFAFVLEELSRKGIGIVTRSDKDYPSKLKALLKKNAPPILYYCGDITLANNDGVSIVGSRNIDDNAKKFAYDLAKKAVNEDLTIFSGGAKGIDTTSEQAAMENGGKVVSILADSLSLKIRRKEVRDKIINKQLLLISATNPDAPFSAGGAMNRNKYIYCLSSAAFVVASDYNKGGTWAGATENIRNKWVKTFVWKNKSYNGNLKLIEKGGISLDDLTHCTLFEMIKKEEHIAQQMDFFSIDYTKNENVAISESTDNYLKTSDKEISHDLFDLVIPVIMELLKEPMDIEELALKLNINKNQASVWVNRAISSGQVNKLSKPVRYIVKFNHE
jgi:predicted Rossmann fold nucleotide-binding protein DprA/Smf involved in DNA uptake